MKDTRETLSIKKCLTTYQWYICTQNNFTTTNYPKKLIGIIHLLVFVNSHKILVLNFNYTKTMIYYDS